VKQSILLKLYASAELFFAAEYIAFLDIVLCVFVDWSLVSRQCVEGLKGCSCHWCAAAAQPAYLDRALTV
jgi:hypothetical protein